MHGKIRRVCKLPILSVLLATTCLAALLAFAGVPGRFARERHTVQIAFGFHVNLYHSFRNDTPDEAGFGKDIRVIREIIDVLDRFNAAGLPVRGVWDFDNMFSLQEILPRHAPDIVEDIRRRVLRNGDEVILMSYNNGLMSAMTRKEALDATRWAMSNPWNSGVADVFGRYSPIVRPQEMMNTPGLFSVYREAGVEAVSLYYSATPFDAFRVFTRPLSVAEAHNPLLFRDPVAGEEMTLIPTYNIGDLMEHTSLRNWTEKLCALQAGGEIDRDLLIFLNFDADSDFWSGVDLHWLFDWLANTEGLAGLIEEVRNMDCVRFTTLKEYLDSHPPAGRVFFGQDTADGSFNGYSSWAEKSDSHWFWTRIQRNRRAHRAAEAVLGDGGDSSIPADLRKLLEGSYMKRMRALSTTHFGMASPFLSPQREKAARALFDELDEYSARIEGRVRELVGRSDGSSPAPPSPAANLKRMLSFFLVPAAENGPGPGPGSGFLKLRAPPPSPPGGALFLEGPGFGPTKVALLGSEKDGDGETWLRLYVPVENGLPKGDYRLYESVGKTAEGGAVRADDRLVSNGRLEVRFDRDGIPEEIALDGVRQVEGGSFAPYVRLEGETFSFAAEETTGSVSPDGLSGSVRMRGTIGAGGRAGATPGRAEYVFSVLADRPYLFVDGEIRYPATIPDDLFKRKTPALARKTEMDWTEVAPAEIRFAPRASQNDPVRVFKSNYLGRTSGYVLDYFRHSPDNLNLDNANNHVVDSWFAVVCEESGMAAAFDNTVLANFAFAPLKVRHEPFADSFRVLVNPFGSYHGAQYTPPTRGNGHGRQAALIAGEQYAPSAPTYNGAAYRFSLMLAFFQGERVPARMRRELAAFAHPPVAIVQERGRSGAAVPKGDLFPQVAYSPCRSCEPLFAEGVAPSASAPDRISEAGETKPGMDIPLDLKLRVFWGNILARF